MKQLDGAVSLNEWSGSGWTCAVARNPDSWVVEAFFPWSDLGNDAKEGSIWRFCNVRYAYTSGKFEGVTSSPGGNYQNSAGFGYLYFSGATPLTAREIGEKLPGKAPPPWLLPNGDDLIICEGKSMFKVEPVADYVKGEKDKALKLAGEAELAIPSIADKTEGGKLRENLNGLKSELGKIDPGKSSVNENLGALKKLPRLAASANEAYWLAKTLRLLEQDGAGPQRN